MLKISPFFELAEKLGSFLSNLVNGVIEEVMIYYSGDLSEFDVRPLTRKQLKAY